jgi:hypothetical protein
VVDGLKNDCEAEAGTEGGGTGGAEKVSSCIDGRDWRGALCCLLSSSPDVRRDSGGESKPPSGPGATLDELADADRFGAGNAYERALSISSRFSESRFFIEGRPKFELFNMVSRQCKGQT